MTPPALAPVTLELIDDEALAAGEPAPAPVEECGLDVHREETGLELLRDDAAAGATQGAASGAGAVRGRGPAPALVSRAPEDDHRLRVVRPEEWCRTCGTRHETGECPGELLATGAERHGWRATFESARGTSETHAVLIAPAAGRWRARIMTYPRALWTIPGSPRTIKFVADQPREAERLARELIEEHCRSRQYRRVREELSTLEVSSFDREQLDSRAEDDAARRRPRSLPVRFAAEGRPLRAATTVDLSENGLFIASENVVPPGTSLKVVLELPGAHVPLRAVVRWERSEQAPGRPRGFGVQLSLPPAIYLHYVRSLP